MKDGHIFETERINPTLDKYQIIKKLTALAEESNDIAEYIGDTVQYGRALGYAEGKLAAYKETAKLILNGEFDAEAGEDDDDFRM